jgi:TM2 domain-containing membrane protein YozV
MFSKNELNLDETELREEVSLLAAPQQQIYQGCVRGRFRSAKVYTRLNMLFFLGAHHFYLQRWLRGSMNLILGSSALFLLLLSPDPSYGLALLIALAIVEIPQFLNCDHIVHARNNRSMRDCLQQARNSLR